jgi:succinate-acetate transporter protein
MIFLNEHFPTNIRATGTALCWNLGYALGGMSPMLVTLFSPHVGDILSSLVLFSVGSTLLFLVGTLLSPRMDERTLEGWSSEVSASAPQSPVAPMVRV